MPDCNGQIYEWMERRHKDTSESLDERGREKNETTSGRKSIRREVMTEDTGMEDKIRF